MDSFEDFAESTLNASAILKPEEIKHCIDTGDVEALYLYAYRIAGFVTVYCHSKRPYNTDEGDIQDAVQECMVQFPELLERYDPSRMPFLKYFSHYFQFIISRYLNTLARGGTGTVDSNAEVVRHAEWATFADDSQESTEAFVEDHEINSIPSNGFSTRDPLIEAEAEETAHYCVAYARSVGKHTTGPWDEPELKPTRKRKQSAKGVAHE